MLCPVTLHNKVGKLGHGFPGNTGHNLYKLVILRGKGHVYSNSLAAFAALGAHLCGSLCGFFLAGFRLLAFNASGLPDLLQRSLSPFGVDAREIFLCHCLALNDGVI